MRPLLWSIGQYRRRYAALFAVLVASAFLEALAVGALYPLLTAFLGTEDAPAGPVLGLLLAVADAIASGDRLVGSLLLFLLVVPLNAAGKLAREWLQARASAKTTYDVKRRVFEKLRTRPYAYFLQRKEGDLTYRLTVAPQNLSAALLFAAVTATYALTSLTTLALLLSIEWRVTVLMLVVGAAFFALNRYVARRFSYNAGREKLAAQSAELSVVHEFTGGVKDILAADASGAWLGRFLAQSRTFGRFFVRDLTWSAVPGVFLELTVLILAAAVAAIVRRVAPDAILALLPILAVYVYATRQMLGTVGLVSRQLLRIASLEPDVALLRAALEERDDDRSAHRAAREVPDWGRLRFDGVSFAYPGRPGAVLDAIDLTIERGRTTALVGASGAGKSTVLALMLGLFEPSAGRILVGDTDLAVLDRKSWLAQVGYVGQELFVYSGTVAENIAFGSDLSLAAVQAAARAAHADDFIQALPLGYATPIGDRGMTLSAGQRQRLVIARALSRDPVLLLLDEATSALDSVSERAVQQALAEVARRCTIVIVAHRLSTVRQADEILVLDRGRVAERGPHETLAAAGGRYAELLRTLETPASAART